MPSPDHLPPLPQHPATHFMLAWLQQGRLWLSYDQRRTDRWETALAHAIGFASS
jgi:hypothetical protein